MVSRLLLWRNAATSRAWRQHPVDGPFRALAVVGLLALAVEPRPGPREGHRGVPARTGADGVLHDDVVSRLVAHRLHAYVGFAAVDQQRTQQGRHPDRVEQHVQRRKGPVLRRRGRPLLARSFRLHRRDRVLRQLPGHGQAPSLGVGQHDRGEFWSAVTRDEDPVRLVDPYFLDGRVIEEWLQRPQPGHVRDDLPHHQLRFVDRSDRPGETPAIVALDHGAGEGVDLIGVGARIDAVLSNERTNLFGQCRRL